jgi:hypothetical protein
MQSPEDPGVRPITEYRTINEPLVPFTTAGHFALGSRVFQGWPGSPGSDGASPYHLERRFMLRIILLVIVVVLVLDSPGGQTLPRG